MTQTDRSHATPSAPQSLALDTSCVVNLLSRDEQPDAALLMLFRFATQGRTTISVTPILETELPDHQGDDGLTDRALNRKFIRDRIGMFSVEGIGAARQGQRDELAAHLLGLLWPNVVPGSRKWDHSMRDCQHIASLVLCGGGIFVSRDGELRRKAKAQQADIPIEVLSPEETLARFPVILPAVLASSSPIVRAARSDDADDISRLMDPIKSSYPNFDGWRQKALKDKHFFIAEVAGRVAGVAVWSKKDDRVAKLSTFYIGDEYQKRGIGPHLLFHQIRLWSAERIEKVYVTVSSERIHILQFFFSYGFRIEGVSTRRYKSGTSEFILSKHLFFERVNDDQFDDFLKRLSAEVFTLPTNDGISAPDRWFMPPNQFELQASRNDQQQVTYITVCQSGHVSQHMKLAELEELTYPARFQLAGREAFMIPIQPKWADELMEVPRSQTSLFPNTDKLRLRTDNAFYCFPKMGPERLSGAPALFYVSRTDQFIAGCARILECRIADPEDLFVEFGDIGIYKIDDIRKHIEKRGKYAGCAMALRFAWWVPFPKPVTLDSLRNSFNLNHPQTVTPIPYDLYERILEAGGIDW